MAALMVRGKLVGLIDGPSIVLEVKGQERTFPLEVSVTLDWVQKHMDGPVTVLLKDGRVVQVS